MTTTKPNTIPEHHTDTAYLSTWLRCYPMLASHPKLLRGMPISNRCREQYPDIVRELHPVSLPAVINFPVVQERLSA